MTTAEKRRRTALHEAAHAVADTEMGRPIDYVSIRSGHTFRGITVPVPRDLADLDGLSFGGVAAQPPALRADVERVIIGTLAGDLAELVLGPIDPPGYRPDDEEAELIARQALAALGPRAAELIGREEGTEPTPTDEENAWRYAYALAGDTGTTHYLEWLRAEARALVWRYRAAILRVADALERHAILRGEQVAALVYPSKEGTSNAIPE